MFAVLGRGLVEEVALLRLWVLQFVLPGLRALLQCSTGSILCYLTAGSTVPLSLCFLTADRTFPLAGCVVLDACLGLIGELALLWGCCLLCCL
jgi:hypothetical protein